MTDFGSSDDHLPLTWVRGHPLYATHVLMVGFIASLLVTTILQFARLEGLLQMLIFSNTQVLAGQVWRILTYGVVNPPSLWFAVDMLMLFWFGRELERNFGRRKFLLFYGGLYVLSPLVLTLMGLWQPFSLVGVPSSLGLFVAFATLSPDAPMMFGLLARWVALILVALYTLMAVAGRDWARLIELWAMVGFAFAFVRHHQGVFSLPSMPRLTEKPAARAPSRAEAARPPVRVAPSAPRPSGTADVDALLDKIARSGIGSLTAAERAQLDQARDRLRKRGSDRG